VVDFTLESLSKSIESEFAGRVEGSDGRSNQAGHRKHIYYLRTSLVLVFDEARHEACDEGDGRHGVDFHELLQ